MTTATPELTFDTNGNLIEKQQTPEITPELLIDFLLREAEVEGAKAIMSMMLSKVINDIKDFITDPEKNNNDAHEIAFALRLSECVRAGLTPVMSRTQKESAELDVVKNIITHPCMKDAINQPDTALKFVHQLADKMEDFVVAGYELLEERVVEGTLSVEDALPVLKQAGMEANTLAVARVQTGRAITLLTEHFAD